MSRASEPGFARQASGLSYFKTPSPRRSSCNRDTRGTAARRGSVARRGRDQRRRAELERAARRRLQLRLHPAPVHRIHLVQNQVRQEPEHHPARRAARGSPRSGLVVREVHAQPRDQHRRDAVVHPAMHRELLEHVRDAVPDERVAEQQRREDAFGRHARVHHPPDEHQRNDRGGEAEQLAHRDAGIAVEVREHPADRGHAGREEPGFGAEPQRLHRRAAVGDAAEARHRDVRAEPGHPLPSAVRLPLKLGASRTSARLDYLECLASLAEHDLLCNPPEVVGLPAVKVGGRVRPVCSRAGTLQLTGTSNHPRRCAAVFANSSRRPSGVIPARAYHEERSGDIATFSTY